MRTQSGFLRRFRRTLRVAVLVPPLLISAWLHAGNLLNVDFGIGTTSAKVGLAATGQTTNDFWNLYSRDDGAGGYRTWGVLTNLQYADRTAGPASLIVSNAPGAWGSGATDIMMSSYLYTSVGQSIEITVSNLPAGLYDLYFYAHGQPGNENGVVHLLAGGVDFGTKSTTTNADWNTEVWDEGRQYVLFSGLPLNIGGLLVITVEPGSGGKPVMNGLQIIESSDCAPAPAGLVGWWRGEGDGADTTGDNEGTPDNGLQYAAGMVTQAFLLDGIDDEVLIPASPSLNVRSFTIEGWINPSDVAEQRPVVEWCATNDYAGVHLWISVVPQGGGSSPGTLWANVRDSANGSHLLTSAPGLIGSNQWSHVALTYDEASGSARLYLNGATVGSADLGTFVPKTGVPLHLGRRPTSCYETWPTMLPFAGQLDEISLYDRALSPAEIQAVFAAGSAGKCPDLCLPSPAGLVGWWRGETNALDTTGSNAGTLQGETSYETGIAGSGFRFDGTNDCVLIPLAASLDLTNYSVEAWVKPLSQVDDPVNQELIFGQGFGKPQLVVRPGTNGLQAVFMFAENLTSFPAAVSTNEIPVNQFSHLAGTWDGATLKVYVNGVLSGDTATTQTPAASSCALYIGGFQDACGFTGQFFNGIVDEVSLYSRALLAEEVQAIFDARSAGKCPPPPPTAPEITVNPASQRVPVGTDATFRVTALGTPPLFYRWYFSTNAIPEATDDVLVLTNIQASDEGDYQVVVGNTSGAATSLVARLTVTIPPVITVQPQGQSVVIGSRVVFSVTAVGAEPLSYLWRRNGLSVPGGTGQILILNNVQTPQAGTYTVRVSNADGFAVSSPAVLRIGTAQLSLLMTSEGPQLNVVGQTNVTFLIDVSSNLVNWSTLATEVSPPASWSFTDPTATGVDRRFYRLRRSP